MKSTATGQITCASQPPHSVATARPAEETTAASLEAQERDRRLQNLGVLATRVAHDLNNMLTPLGMAAPLLRRSTTDPAARSLLETLESTVSRATTLVRQILEYSHHGGGRYQLVMIRHLLKEVARFASETFPREIRVEEDFAPDLWPINAHLSQVHQVLLNLCVNARDAMAGGGTLRLGAANCRLDEAAAARLPGARPGDFLVMRVEDTGPGIPPAVMERIWQPYNTTKDSAHGSGLGLSTVHDIVKAHGGFIQLQNRPGQGASFALYLPARTGDPAVLG